MKNITLILTVGLLFIILFSFSTSTIAANLGDVVINEVAWMGTDASTADEWIELYNTTSGDIDMTGWRIYNNDLSPDHTLTGIIPANGYYYLLERTDDTTVNDIPYDETFTGAIDNVIPDTTLTLEDDLGQVIDTANGDGGPWPAGTNSPNATMERIDPFAADIDANWGTNDGVTRNGLDANGNLINGTPKNTNSVFSVSYPTPGPFMGLDFDGIDDHVQVTHDATFNFGTTGTLEAWIYMFGTSDGAGNIHKGDGTTGESYSLRFGFGTQNDQVELVVRDASGADTITSDTDLTPKSWYHVAGSWDGTNMKLYINGIESKTGSSTKVAQNSAEKLIIGARYDFGTDSFFGRIDEVRIWDDVRSIAEIRTNMCKKQTGSEPDLAGYWRFDEIGGTYCFDQTSNSNVGVMTNMDPTTDRICSRVPLGDDSAYDYTGSSPADFAVNLAGSDGDDITATGEGGTWSTATDSVLHVYRVDEAPNITTAPFGWKGFDSALRYWGVFVAGGTNPTYTIEYDYGDYPATGGYPGIANEDALALAYRTHCCEFWKNANATLDISTNTLTREGLHGTEFILGSNMDPRNAIDYGFGTDDYVGVTDENSLDLGSTGTLEAWINISSHTTSGGIIHKGDNSGLGDEAYLLSLGAGSNTIVFTLRDGFGSDSITSTTALSTNTWYHVAGVWDTGATNKMTIYINGVNDQTGASARSPRNSAGGLNIGKQFTAGAGSYYPFDGLIDEVRIWNIARNQSDIRDYMCRKLSGSENGLVGYWRFDQESASITCPDYDFGTKNNGTMYNFGTSGDVITARICSPAPIGDDSAYGYGTSTAISSATLGHTDGDYLFATEDTGTWNNTFSGLHVYRLDEAPVYPPDIATSPYAYSPNGLTPPPGWSSIDYYRYWGVFVTDWTTTPTYQVKYNYNGNPSVPIDETVLALAKRDQYCDRTWADAAATLNTTTNTLTKSGETGTEYILGGTDAPLAIALASFFAEVDDSGECIRVSWETATEIETIGFQLWRSIDKDGQYELITDSFIASQAVMESEGASYSFLDCDVYISNDSSYYYKLEEIDFDNTRNNPVYGPIGPVTETVSASQFSTSKSTGADSTGCFIGALNNF